MENNPLVPKEVHPMNSSDLNPFPFKFVFITLASVLGILVIIGVSWYFLGGGNQQASQSDPFATRSGSGINSNVSTTQEKIIEVPTDTPLPTAEPTPTVAPITASWKRYTSKGNGYTFLFPETYTTTILPQSDLKISEFVVVNPASSSPSAVMDISVSYSTRTYEQALALSTAPAEAVIYGGVTGSRKVMQNSQGEISVHIILPDQKNSITFVAKDKYKDLLYQILSTFKFL